MPLRTLALVLVASLAWAQGADQRCCDDPQRDCCNADDDEPPPLPPVVVAPPQVYAPPLVYVPAPIYVPVRKKHENRFLLQLTLGAAYQYVLEESMGGFAADVMMGAEDAHWGGGAQAGIVAGRTAGGLTYYWFRFGPGFEFHVSRRARLGFGISVGTLQVKRALDAQWMDSFTMGAHLDFSVDLARGSHGNALFAAARLGGDMVFDVYDLSPGALRISAGLGYRM